MDYIVFSYTMSSSQLAERLTSLRDKSVCPLKSPLEFSLTSALQALQALHLMDTLDKILTYSSGNAWPREQQFQETSGQPVIYFHTSK